MFDERPIVLLVHAINDLIAGGYHLYPDGRCAIAHALDALRCLLLLDDLNRLSHDDLQAFVDYTASRIEEPSDAT